MIKTAILGLVLLASSGAWAKEIRIATFEHDTPQITTAIRVMTEIYQRIGHNMTIVRFPGKRSLVEANLGSTEGELIRIKAIEHSYPNLVHVPYTIGSLTGVALVRKGQPEIASLSGLLGKRVGVMRGVEFTTILTKKLDHEILNSIDSLFSILLSGRVDVILFPALDAQKYIKHHGLEGKVDVSARPIVEIPLYHFLHKDSQAIADELSIEMKRMENSGALEKLMKSAEQSQQQ